MSTNIKIIKKNKLENYLYIKFLFFKNHRQNNELEWKDFIIDQFSSEKIEQTFIFLKNLEMYEEKNNSEKINEIWRENFLNWFFEFDLAPKNNSINFNNLIQNLNNYIFNSEEYTIKIQDLIDNNLSFIYIYNYIANVPDIPLINLGVNNVIDNKNYKYRIIMGEALINYLNKLIKNNIKIDIIKTIFNLIPIVFDKNNSIDKKIMQILINNSNKNSYKNSSLIYIQEILKNKLNFKCEDILEKCFELKKMINYINKIIFKKFTFNLEYININWSNEETKKELNYSIKKYIKNEKYNLYDIYSINNSNKYYNKYENRIKDFNFVNDIDKIESHIILNQMLDEVQLKIDLFDINKPKINFDEEEEINNVNTSLTQSLQNIEKMIQEANKKDEERIKVENERIKFLEKKLENNEDILDIIYNEIKQDNLKICKAEKVYIKSNLFNSNISNIKLKIEDSLNISKSILEIKTTIDQLSNQKSWINLKKIHQEYFTLKKSEVKENLFEQIKNLKKTIKQLMKYNNFLIQQNNTLIKNSKIQDSDVTINNNQTVIQYINNKKKNINNKSNKKNNNNKKLEIDKSKINQMLLYSKFNDRTITESNVDIEKIIVNKIDKNIDENLINNNNLFNQLDIQNIKMINKNIFDIFLKIKKSMDIDDVLEYNFLKIYKFDKYNLVNIENIFNNNNQIIKSLFTIYNNNFETQNLIKIGFGQDININNYDLKINLIDNDLIEQYITLANDEKFIKDNIIIKNSTNSNNILINFNQNTFKKFNIKIYDDNINSFNIMDLLDFKIYWSFYDLDQKYAHNFFTNKINLYNELYNYDTHIDLEKIFTKYTNNLNKYNIKNEWKYTILNTNYFEDHILNLNAFNLEKFEFYNSNYINNNNLYYLNLENQELFKYLSKNQSDIILKKNNFYYNDEFTNFMLKCLDYLEINFNYPVIKELINDINFNKNSTKEDIFIKNIENKLKNKSSKININILLKNKKNWKSDKIKNFLIKIHNKIKLEKFNYYNNQEINLEYLFDNSNNLIFQNNQEINLIAQTFNATINQINLKILNLINSYNITKLNLILKSNNIMNLSFKSNKIIIKTNNYDDEDLRLIKNWYKTLIEKFNINNNNHLDNIKKIFEKLQDLDLKDIIFYWFENYEKNDLFNYNKEEYVDCNVINNIKNDNKKLEKILNDFNKSYHLENDKILLENFTNIKLFTKFMYKIIKFKMLNNVNLKSINDAIKKWIILIFNLRLWFTNNYICFNAINSIHIVEINYNNKPFKQYNIINYIILKEINSKYDLFKPPYIFDVDQITNEDIIYNGGFFALLTKKAREFNLKYIKEDLNITELTILIKNLIIFDKDINQTLLNLVNMLDNTKKINYDSKYILKENINETYKIINNEIDAIFNYKLDNQFWIEKFKILIKNQKNINEESIKNLIFDFCTKFDITWLNICKNLIKYVMNCSDNYHNLLYFDSDIETPNIQIPELIKDLSNQDVKTLNKLIKKDRKKINTLKRIILNDQLLSNYQSKSNINLPLKIIKNKNNNEKKMSIKEIQNEILNKENLIEKKLDNLTNEIIDSIVEEDNIQCHSADINIKTNFEIQLMSENKTNNISLNFENAKKN